MPQARKGRLHYLDTLRGVAALSVVFFHYTMGLPNEHVLQGVESVFVNFTTDTIDLGKFGVVLFFLISGYIIPHSFGNSPDKIRKFIIIRVFRLYPLYWMATAIGIFFYGSFSVVAILANVTMIQNYLGQPNVIAAAWTLQIELTFYGCCVLLALTNRLNSPNSCVALSYGFLLLALVVAILRNMLMLKLPVALPLALSLMFFGTIWRQATLDGQNLAKRLALWLGCTIFIAVIPISYFGYLYEGWHSYAICYMLSIFVFLVFTTRILVEWRFLAWIGEISYSLYLTHPLVEYALRLTGINLILKNIDYLLYPILLFVPVVLCSWFTYSFVEKPFIRIGRALAHSNNSKQIFAGTHS